MFTGEQGSQKPQKFCKGLCYDDLTRCSEKAGRMYKRQCDVIIYESKKNVAYYVPAFFFFFVY